MRKHLKSFLCLIMCFCIIFSSSYYESQACPTTHYFTLTAVDPLVNGSFAGSSKVKLTVQNHVAGAQYKFVWCKGTPGNEDWSEWGVISQMSSATTLTFYLPNTTGNITIIMDRQLSGQTPVGGFCKRTYNLPTTVGAYHHNTFSNFKTLPSNMNTMANWQSKSFFFNSSADDQFTKIFIESSDHWVWETAYGQSVTLLDTFIVYKKYITINGVPYDVKLQLNHGTGSIAVPSNFVGFAGVRLDAGSTVGDISDVMFELSIYKASTLGDGTRASSTNNAAYKYYTDDANKIPLRDIYMTVSDLDGTSTTSEMLRFKGITDVYTHESGYDMVSMRAKYGNHFGLRYNASTGTFTSHWTTYNNHGAYYNDDGVLYTGYPYDPYAGDTGINAATAFLANPANNTIEGQYRNGRRGFQLNIAFMFKQYKVTYKATNGSITAVTGGTKNADGTWLANSFSRYNLEGVTLKPNTGYKFSHWLYNNKQYTDAQRKAITATSDMTWTAVFVPINYSVKYNGNTNTGGSTTTSAHVYDTAKALTTNGFTKTGYRFNGWNTNTAGTGTNYADKASVKNLSSTDGATVNLYAKWLANTYTIKYDGNKATGGSTANASHTYDTAKTLTANGYSRTGYTFTGWNTKADGTGTSYVNKVSVKNLTTTHGATITLYAQWKPISYEVSYSGNTNTSGTMTNSEHIYDVAKELTENKFLKVGYTFSHWLSGTKTYTDKQTVVNLTTTANAIVDMAAQWTANTYTIKYNGNGATSGTTMDSTHTYDKTKNLTENGYSREGYSYLGWNTKSDGTGTTYLDTAPVLNLTDVPDAILNLYAQWRAHTYTVKYHGNDYASGEMEDSIHTYDVAKNLNENKYFKENGYVFDSWNTKPDGTGIKYADKETVKNLTPIDNGVVDLYTNFKQVLKIVSKKNFYFKDTELPYKAVIPNAVSIDEHDGNISENIVIKYAIYPDGTKVDNPVEIDTSKECTIQVRYFVTNSNGVHAWVDNEIYIVAPGSTITLDDDDVPNIYNRFISNIELYDGVNALDTLSEISIWKETAYQLLLESSLQNNTYLQEYDYINNDSFKNSL